MNTNKNLLGTLFLAIGVFACTLSAHAASYYVLVNSIGAKGETEKPLPGYEAYYCTKDAAKGMFGGADTYQTITTFLTANMANYDSGMSALKTGGVALPPYGEGFDEGIYSFATDVTPLTLGSEYLAVLAYTGADAENRVRVFSNTAGSSDLTFDPLQSKGVAGDWTTVNVPEPTSGLLLLLGVAGLAFRRPASRKRYAATSKRA